MTMTGQHPNMTEGTFRQLLTLAEIMDAIARNEPGRAADLAGQRMKAMEQAQLDGHWRRAMFIELIDPAGRTLLERDEAMATTHEANETLKMQKLEAKLRTKTP